MSYGSGLDEISDVARKFLNGCVVEALDVGQQVLLFICRTEVDSHTLAAETP